MLANALIPILVVAVIVGVLYWSKLTFEAVRLRERGDAIISGIFATTYGSLLGLYAWSVISETSVSLPFRLALLSLIVMPIIKNQRRRRILMQAVKEAQDV